MYTFTFINGMERFNAHIWDDVLGRLRADGLPVQVCRFHDGHIDAHDPTLASAIRRADVVFISLINMREQATWLAEQLAEAAPQAIFAYESMPEVMALTRVGDYRVAEKREKSGPMQAMLRLITRGRDEDALYAYSKLTKSAMKLLPLMPAKLKDFRTWLTVNIYWNQPDAANLTQMLRLILRDCLHQSVDVAPPRIIPMMGCFHPDAPELFEGPEQFFRWKKRAAGRSRAAKRPLVALLAFRKHLVQGQAYLAEMVRALEGEGLDVLPIFVSGIEAHVAVREWLTRQPIEMLISTMGFALVGGPAGSTKPGQYQEKAADLLAGLDVPYMVVQPLQMQSESEWHERGVAPMQAVIMYDLPEMDGSIAPVVLGAIRGQQIVATPDRLARAALLAARWVQLRRKPRSQRRIACVLYNFPPGTGKLGTAALLDVPASLHALLGRMQQDGYTVAGAPASAEELARRISALEQPAAALAMPAREYRAAVPAAQAERVERAWGGFPGDLAPASRDAVRIDGFTLGNVFVGVQPPMGIPGDPMRLLFDPDFVPHHQYIGFYRWLSDVWQADAILHVGMHGTAEWMPGLQLGLTGDCWPDALLGTVPNLYLYPLNNPAEAAIARRRGYAEVISHLVPPYARAGSYKQLATLRATLASADLPDLPRTAGEDDDHYRQRADAYLNAIEERLVLDGLHTFGSTPGAERMQALLEAALDIPRNGALGLSNALRAAGVQEADLATSRSDFIRDMVHPAAERWAHLPHAAAYRDQGRTLLQRLAESDELGALLHALDGGYIRPAIGADPVRAGAGALPSGRNIHSIDPWRLPGELALLRGQQMADLLLARHRAEHGTYPPTVAQTLWALDAIKSEGEALAVVLALVGARPERDGQGKIWQFTLIPLEELGRPRVDVLLDISPIFRDTFQMTLDLLDSLFRRAAEADEPLEQNFIRAHAVQMQQHGQSWDAATARIFTQSPGRYGTGVDERIDESQWEDAGELSETYLQRSSFSYGGRRAGAPAPETLRHMIGTVAHVFQPIDSVEYGLTDMQHYYGHSGAIQQAASRARGSSVPLSYAESHTGSIHLTDAQELLNSEVRAKILNPRWYEALLSHGFAGAAEIGNRFTYLLGWSAVSGNVQPWVFSEAAATFVLDDAMRARLEAANPHATRNAIARLLEAHGRGLWPTDEETIARLQALYADIEDRLESQTL